MTLVKIQDIAYIRFRAPDLLRMQRFLEAFGMSPAEDIADGVLRMRGCGPAPFLHETVEGAPGFAGVGFRAASIADLERLAMSEGKKIEEINAVGGGKRVRLVDPNGFDVEIVAGQSERQGTSFGPDRNWNDHETKSRIDIVKRLNSYLPQVCRLGHAVFFVDDLAKTRAWWTEKFGLLTSDEVRLPDGGLAALFMRCDRDDQPVDHHVLNIACVPNAGSKFHHAAFEVANMDDLMLGHEILKRENYRHSWGIGRHVLGSQVFDYWEDPWGNRLEHWTDGDLLTASHPMNVTDLKTMLGHQWGPSAPEDFV